MKFASLDHKSLTSRSSPDHEAVTMLSLRAPSCRPRIYAPDATVYKPMHEPECFEQCQLQRKTSSVNIRSHFGSSLCELPAMLPGSKVQPCCPVAESRCSAVKDGSCLGFCQAIPPRDALPTFQLDRVFNKITWKAGLFFAAVLDLSTEIQTLTSQICQAIPPRDALPTFQLDRVFNKITRKASLLPSRRQEVG